MSALALVSDEGLGGVVAFGKHVRERGLTPLLITGPVAEHRLDAWREIYARTATVEEPYDPEVLARTASTLAGGENLAGLFSCYDGLIVPAAEAAKRLGLAHPQLAGLVRSRNKLEMRRALQRAGLPGPRFAAVNSSGGGLRALERVGLPAVLKPLNGMASHLVARIEGEEALAQAYRHSRRQLQRDFAANYRHLPSLEELGPDQTDATQTLLLEEYLSGAEYSAEVIVREGEVHRIALFHKFLISERGFLECGFTRPSLGLEHRSEAVWKHIEECLAALGVDNAAAHVEVIDTESGPRLVEVNAGRAGGQILVSAVREATGIDLIDEIVSLALGEERPEPSGPTFEGRVSTLTVFPPRSGQLESIRGVRGVEALPGVARVVLFCSPGDVLEVDDKEVFAVNLLVLGGDGDSLRELYRQACAHLTFQFEPRALGAGGEVTP